MVQTFANDTYDPLVSCREDGAKIVGAQQTDRLTVAPILTIVDKIAQWINITLSELWGMTNINQGEFGLI